MSGDGSYADELSGELDGAGRRVAVLVARFNADVTDLLRDRVVATLVEHGIDPEGIEVFEVPGAWELPQTAARLSEIGRYDALIAIGCVIRGETPHFDFIAGEATRGLGAIARGGPTPLLFGVLTTETPEQASERASPAGLDKGREIALGALRMMTLYEQIGRLES